jgi:hypothetical protein
LWAYSIILLMHARFQKVKLLVTLSWLPSGKLTCWPWK